MDEDVNPHEAITTLEEFHQRMKADRAWLELTADQFQPHSQISMNAWLHARRNFAESSLFFEFTYQQIKDSL